MTRALIFALILLNISCDDSTKSSLKQEYQKQKMIKNKENILKELDSVFKEISDTYGGKESHSNIKYNFFLDLEHGYVETAGSKIHLFGDEKNWAIVFEKIGYHNRAFQIQSELNFIGNCINYKKENHGYGDEYTNTEDIALIDNEELEKIQLPENEEEDCFEMIDPTIDKVKIRNSIISIKIEQDEFAKLHMNLVDENNPKGYISFGNFARYLYAKQPNELSANQSEIRKQLPNNIPFIMTIDKFHYKSSYEPKNKPSTQETYNLIADVLVSLNKELWKPKEIVNNDWYNWESGHL
ncbi:MAG: hypothetical protein RL660_2324 [Bacteroidota bacterium]|jgi:hypothetical protein